MTTKTTETGTSATRESRLVFAFPVACSRSREAGFPMQSVHRRKGRERICSKPNKDDLAKHESSADHRRSTTVKRQQEFVTAAVTANDHAKAAVIAQTWTVLTQADGEECRAGRSSNS